ncbi:Asp23/Gls24 family envelope stress response protein [Microlunatus soli]|uniref:Uncharacterized conserved protein YloU, alkaline shock protein (Asp23) family n=1 Tax=Microlunatus soli TaxID=630515 RepID=A0A1H1XDQ9_9ACTN|nr:Uncharacterized conserved protein YloU, alkaline shock protein (Asp23) family [Microlunatus soli]
MTDSTASSLPKTSDEARREAPATTEPERKQLDALHTERGDTTIADTVVQKLAGIAAREVPGVFAMGNPVRRAFNALTERIPGSQTNVAGGVTVEKGERQTAVDVSVILEYGASVVDVSQGIRTNIIDSVERATGLEVIEVNVNVTDVHLPEDDDAPAAEQSSELA